jgi:mannose-1-phosphate guanylyltransferase
VLTRANVSVFAELGLDERAEVPFRAKPQTGDEWAIVLAGGDGTRVRDLTKGPNGVSVPKQYCTFGCDRSLLGLAFDRARRVVGPDRVVVVVAEQHRPWWELELGRPPDAVPAENVVVQPSNRGTAVGVLAGLARVVSRQGSLARVLVLPSDHYVDQEETLIRHLEQGVLAARQDPSRVVLFGMTPESVDAEYGWILSPAASRGVARPVVRFVEKPDTASSQQLIERGALLNSFIFVARAATLLLLYWRVMPEILGRFLPRVTRPDGWTRGVLRRLYRTLPSLDFSRELLERCTDDLAVVPVPPCGWSDLGTPARLTRFQQQREREALGRASRAGPGWSPAARSLPAF